MQTGPAIVRSVDHRSDALQLNGCQRSLRWPTAANLVLILRELSRISAKLNAEASRGASVTETTRAGRIRSKDVGSTCRYYKKTLCYTYCVGAT